MCFGELGSCESVLDRDKTLSYLPSTAQGFGECTEQPHVTVEKPGLTKLIKSAAEKWQPSDNITALDPEYCFKGMG